jgi:hypothetical protein
VQVSRHLWPGDRSQVAVRQLRFTIPGVGSCVLAANSAICVRQFCASRVRIGPDSGGFHRSRFRTGKPKRALQSRLRLTYDIFEGTAEIQQLVIARAISGMHIK